MGVQESESNIFRNQVRLLKSLIESEKNDHWQDDHRQRVDDLTSLRVV